MKRILAIIPARGGSKRIPRKNIKSFLGKPVITYSIETALKTNIFDEVMVSTDDEKIAGISKKSGASIPFLRSPQNSNDTATLSDVLGEVLLQYKKKGRIFDYFCCILSTAPLITSEQLIEGYGLLKKHSVDVVIPVVRFGFPIQRAFKIEDDQLKMIWPKYMFVNSQKLITSYHDAGQFYWIKTIPFLQQKRIFAKKAFPLIVPELAVQDIDTEEDWKLAELKYTMLTTISNLKKNREKS